MFNAISFRFKVYIEWVFLTKSNMCMDNALIFYVNIQDFIICTYKIGISFSSLILSNNVLLHFWNACNTQHSYIILQVY